MSASKTNKVGKGTVNVSCNLEITLVKEIDRLAARDGLKRSTWMREAIISAHRSDERFQRTPTGAYHTVITQLPTLARAAEDPGTYQTGKKAKKAG